MSNNEPIKKRGRRPVDTEQVRSRVGRPILDGIDRWIAEQPDPKPDRADALRVALTDWLTSLGYLPQHDDPEMAN